jgi:flagellar basal body-associated protein FliL
MSDMLIRLSSWVSKVSTLWTALISAVIFSLFTVFVLPGQSDSSNAQLSEAGTPDLSFYYSSTELYQMAESYGEQGRQAYISARFTFDLIWPLVYGFFLIATLGWLLKIAFPLDSRWQRANLLPLFGMLFDYLENISTSLVMARFPIQTPIVDGLAGIFTSLKWILIVASFILLVVAMVMAIWRIISPANGKKVHTDV